MHLAPLTGLLTRDRVYEVDQTRTKRSRDSDACIASQPIHRERRHWSSVSGTRTEHGGNTILVVDDEPSIVDAVATALR